MSRGPHGVGFFMSRTMSDSMRLVNVKVFLRTHHHAIVGKLSSHPSTRLTIGLAELPWSVERATMKSKQAKNASKSQPKRIRQPDTRTAADRPGCVVFLRLGETETEELDWWRGDIPRPQAVRLALEEKYARFARGKVEKVKKD